VGSSGGGAAQQLVAPDRLIESLFAASFRFCGVLGLGWCRCETRRRLNSGSLGGASEMKLAFKLDVVETNFAYKAVYYHRANKHSQARYHKHRSVESCRKKKLSEKH